MIILREVFESKLSTWIKRREGVVVGLSGGADSLCLTMLLNEYARKFDIRLVACMVDQ